MHRKDQRLQFINIQKQSHVKPSKMHKKLHVSFKHSFKWTKKVEYIFLVETFFFFSFHVKIGNNSARVQHHIKEQSQGTVTSKETRRLLLKSTKRTRDFNRRNVVKWFSSMPHNSSNINNSFEFPASIRDHSWCYPIFEQFLKKHFFLYSLALITSQIGSEKLKHEKFSLRP